MGKNTRKVTALAQKQDNYELSEAVDFLQTNSYVKFDQTLDIAVNLNIDAKQSDQNVRGVVSLPSGTGRVVRIVVISHENDNSAVLEAGADVVGGANIVADIADGKIPVNSFDVCIATPQSMGIIGRIAKILGPRGMMPNPKTGTVTTDLVATVNKIKKGQVSYRSDKYGVVHAGVGKLSFSKDNLLANIETFIASLNSSRPNTVKGGNFIKDIYLSSTMGPSLRITNI